MSLERKSKSKGVRGSIYIDIITMPARERGSGFSLPSTGLHPRNSTVGAQERGNGDNISLSWPAADVVGFARPDVLVSSGIGDFDSIPHGLSLTTNEEKRRRSILRQTILSPE